MEGIEFEYSKLSKNVILQFGHQSYPTTFNKSGFNKVIYLKKNLAIDLLKARIF